MDSDQSDMEFDVEPYRFEPVAVSGAGQSSESPNAGDSRSTTVVQTVKLSDTDTSDSDSDTDRDVPHGHGPAESVDLWYVPAPARPDDMFFTKLRVCRQ